MAKFIIDAHDDGRKYDYNLYTAHHYIDGEVSEDARKIATDNIDEFLEELKKVLVTAK